ncbi:MAG: hypothetical protein WD492_04385 [Alkalispirochaeta sp.]
MKRTSISIVALLKVLGVVAVALALAACSPGGDSPQDLVKAFFRDIDNGTYSNIKSYLDSGADNYNQVNDDYWTSQFPGNSYEITSLSGSDPVDAEVTEGSTTGSYRFEFSGSEGNIFNDSDYKIKKITETSGSSDSIIFQ